ncbi:Protein YfjI [Durusdinium trenchii]|uniref:Protein YfjI n=1 Tax=Durusdinium trenchii TaxID=1381693 RepID=A0ABP0LEA7_9DINO
MAIEVSTNPDEQLSDEALQALASLLLDWGIVQSFVLPWLKDDAPSGVHDALEQMSVDADALVRSLPENGGQTLVYVVHGWDDDGAGVEYPARVYTDRRQALEFAGSLDDAKVETWQNGERIKVENATDVNEQWAQALFVLWLDYLSQAIFEVCRQHQPLTVRQAFYRLVVIGAILKTQAEYKSTVCRLIGRMREEGELPWEWIVDETRWQRKPVSWCSLASMLEHQQDFYRRDLWNDQGVYVEVWCESDSAAGVLYPITSKWDVPLMAARGFSSKTFLYNAAQALRRINHVGQPCHIAYFGDHDPSGVHIDRDIREKLTRYGAEEFTFERIAVTTRQIAEWELPGSPPKKRDSRSRKFDGEAVELEAIAPGDLRQLCEDYITGFIDDDRLQRSLAVESAEKDTLVCPICEKPDWCSVKDVEGEIGVAYCMRVESGTKKGEGWIHVLKDESCRNAIRALEKSNGKRSADWTYYRGADPICVIARWNLPGGKKDIRPVTRNCSGWFIGAMPEPRALYNLPQVLEADLVGVGEGEQTADALTSLGLVGTTSSGGCRAVDKTDWSPLAGKDVVIWRDNDQDGLAYQGAVIAALAPLDPPPTIRVIRIDDGWPAKYDAADWVANGGTREKFENLLAEAELIELVLPDKPLSYQPFPADVLPDQIREYILAEAAAIGVDPAMVAIPFLAAMATAIGNSRSVLVRHGWVEHCVLWLALLAESGSGKTPGARNALQPIKERDAQAYRDNEPAMEDYRRLVACYEVDLGTWKQQRKKGSSDPPPDKPVPPVAKRACIQDCTIEKTAEVLQGNTRGVLKHCDELSGLLGGMDRYSDGKGGERANLLSAWSAVPMVLDRKVSASSYVESPRLSIFGGVQPDLIHRIIGDDDIAAGLPARFLWAMPPTPALRWSDRSVPDHLQVIPKQVIDRLYALAATVDEETGAEKPVLVKTSKEAQRHLQQFVDRNAELSDDTHGGLRAALAKLPAQVARLALVLYCAADACYQDVGSTISGSTMEQAIRLGEWFGNEAQRLYSLRGEDDVDRDRRELVEWILRKGGEVTMREVQQGRREFATTDEVEAALHDLAAHGYGEMGVGHDMNRLPRLIMAYLARIGVECRVVDGELQVWPLDRLKGNDLENIRFNKAEIIELIESGERVVDTFRWSPRFDTPEHQARLHRQLKGQYVPSDITTDRHIMLLESMVDFERERWRQIEAECEEHQRHYQRQHDKSRPNSNARGYNHSPRTQALWRSVVPKRAKTPERLAMIQTALEALDRADTARAEVERTGMTTTTKTTGIGLATLYGRELDQLEKFQLDMAVFNQERRRHDYGMTLLDEGKPYPTIFKPLKSDAPEGVQFTNSAGKATVWLYGPIGGLFGISADEFRGEMSRISQYEDILVRVHSEGGAVFDSIAIYQQLLAHKGKVTVHVDGMAASGASLISMAGDEITMAVGSTMMIHLVGTSVLGATAEELDEYSRLAKEQDQALVDIYMTRWNGTREELYEALRRETWFTPYDAIENGLADSISTAQSVENRISAQCRYRNVPSMVTVEGSTMDCVNRNLASLFLHRTQKFSTGIMKAQRLSARMGVSLGAMGAAATATGVAMLRSAENIERAMTKSLAIMGDVSDTMRGDMVDAANRVAKATEASTAQAAQSYFYLASAGMTAEQSLKAMPVVAKFAQAGNFDLALATDLATDAQSALGLSSEDTYKQIENLSKVTDVLVKGNTLANASVQQFSEALTNGAAASLRLANKDMTEGVAILAAYADQGIKGAEAGTAFGIVMRDLQTKAIQNKAAFRSAGIAVFDMAGNMNNIGDIIEDVEGLLAGLSDEQKKFTLLQLGFSDKSVKYIQSLVGMSDKIAEYEKNLRNAAGTAAEVAEKSMTDLQRASAQASSAWDRMAISIAEAAENLGLYKAAAEAMEGVGVVVDTKNGVAVKGGKGDIIEKLTTSGSYWSNPLNGLYRDFVQNMEDTGRMPTSIGPANPEWAKKWESRQGLYSSAEDFAEKMRVKNDSKVMGQAVRDGIAAVQGFGKRGAMQFGRGVDSLSSAWSAAEDASRQRALGNLTGGLFGTTDNLSGVTRRAQSRQESIANLERQLEMASMGGGSRRSIGSLSLTRSGSVASYRQRRRIEGQQESRKVGNKTEQKMEKLLQSINKKMDGGIVLSPSNIA